MCIVSRSGFLAKSSLISHINGAGTSWNNSGEWLNFRHLDRSSSYGANLPAWVYATPDVASCLHVICVSVSQPTLNIYRVFMYIPYIIVPKCQTVKGLKKHRSFAEFLKPWKCSVSYRKLQSRCFCFRFLYGLKPSQCPVQSEKDIQKKILASYVYIYIYIHSDIAVSMSKSHTVQQWS